MNVRFEPSGPLRGTLRVPADKSISHRAALIGALASGPVRITNYLRAADTNCTLAAVRELGVIVEERDDHLLIRGRGLRNVPPPAGVIDVGNAGTLMRLLPGWLAFQPGVSVTLDGDESIRRRPVDRIAEPLGRLGAAIDARDGRFPPFTIHGAALAGIEYELPVASAQVKSCVLIAGLGTERTTVTEPVPTRDHTERLLLRAGASLERGALERGAGALPEPRALERGALERGASRGALERGASQSEAWRTTVLGGDELGVETIAVPGDLSSAAFLIAAGVLVSGSRLLLRGVGVNWTRAGFLRILERMGAIVLGELEAEGAFGPEEPTADLDVRSAPIQGTTIEAWEVPLAIDELPLVALLGCFAEGETLVRGASELRFKESDRIATVVDGLRGLGADIEASPDGFLVRGTGGLRGGRLDASADHRLALLGAVAGLASSEGVEVVGMEASRVSYPRFAEDLARLVS